MTAILRVHTGDPTGGGEEIVGVMRETVERDGLQELDETILASLIGTLLDRADPDLLGRLLDLTATGLAGHPSPLGVGLLALLASGPSDEVVVGLCRAIAKFDAFSGTLYVRRAQAQLAAVLAELGQIEEADDFRRQVREFYESLVATAWLRELDAA